MIDRAPAAHPHRVLHLREPLHLLHELHDHGALLLHLVLQRADARAQRVDLGVNVPPARRAAAARARVDALQLRRVLILRRRDLPAQPAVT